MQSSSNPRLVLVLMVLGAMACAPPEPRGELAFLRGLNAMAEQRYDWARRLFAQAFEEDGERWEAVRLEGIAWLQGVSQALEPAVESFRRYLQHAPEDAEIRQRLARCLLLLGEHEEALAWLEGLEPSSELQCLRAELLLDAEPRLALELLHGVGLGDPLAHRAYDLASQAHGLLGEDAAAMVAAGKSLQLDPLQPQVRYRLSRLLVRQGRLEAAQREVELSQQMTALLATESPWTPEERLLRLDDLAGDVDLQNPHVVEQRVRWMWAAGRGDEARRLMAELPTVEGLDLELQLQRADWLVQRGPRDEGHALFERLLATGDRRVHQHWIGEAMGRRDWQEARRRIEDGLRLEPHLGRYHRLLADLELHEGQRDAALAALQRAVHLAPWKAEWRRDLVQMLLDDGLRDRAAELLAAAPEGHPLLDDLRRRHWPLDLRPVDLQPRDLPAETTP